MSCVCFDFKELRCSLNNRQRLAKIYKDVQSPQTTGAAERRLRLCNLLATCAYDPKRGLYVPLSNTIYLRGKLQSPLIELPTLTVPVQRHFYSFFSNPLVIPPGHGLPDFDSDLAATPIDRLTNAGWMVVTVEFDWESVEEFDKNLEWFAGKDGDFRAAPFAQLDKELQRHHEYRGFCAVYSGGRSVHMHFLYDTKHLTNAPWDADAQTRIDWQSEIAAVMKEAHELAWTHVVGHLSRILKPSREPDSKLQSPVQWRRAPFGINELTKDYEFLGLKNGQPVPQVPLYENIRTRRPKGSTDWLLDKHLAPPTLSRSRLKSKAKNASQSSQVPEEALEIVRHACEDQWGTPYPSAMKIGFQDGEAIIHFANHPGDKNPSSIALGDFKKLRILGRNRPEGDFYLPGDCTANEFVSWAMEIATEHNRLTHDDSNLTPEERKTIIAREHETVAKSTE
jgi:hypothetical protein